MIELSTTASYDLDLYEVLDVYAAHRDRFVHQLADLSIDEWAAPTRCREWNVQQVARHLCDVNTRGMSDENASPFDDFDPRTTPNDWMRPSDGEAPSDTLARLRTTSPTFFAHARAAADAGLDQMIKVPFGEEPWPVMIVHAFWDSWLHERDVVVPLDLDHRTDELGTQLATAYGLFISTAVAKLFGNRVNETFVLSGVGAGSYDVRSDDTGVHVRVKDGDSGTIDAVALTDALAGRGPRVPGVPDALWALGDFFNTPV